MLGSLFSKWRKPKALSVGTPHNELVQKAYGPNFKNAVAFTERHGLLAEPLPQENGAGLTDQTMMAIAESLNEFVVSNLGGNYENLSGQCFTVNVNVGLDLRRILGDAGPILTLGSVHGYKGRMFGVDFPVFESMLNQPHRGKDRLDMHAWLTFPSNEVVDLTLLTTASVINADIGLPAKPGAIFYGTADELPMVWYEPQAVGLEVLNALGMFRGMVL